MRRLVDSDWLIDAFLGIPAAVNLMARLTLLPLDDATMERFAYIRAELRRRGQFIPDLDLLIAATALRNDLTLLTRNVRHFGRIPDLMLYQPN